MKTLKPAQGQSFRSSRSTGTASAVESTIPERTGMQGETMLAFKKILFPTDFSASADKALAHAIRLADFDDGEL